MLLPVAAQYAEALADWLRLIRHARQRGCFRELNAQPKRLDLIDIHAQLAREEGVLVAINSDAHTVHDFNNLDNGIGQARCSWLEAADVLNTRPLDALRLTAPADHPHLPRFRHRPLRRSCRARPLACWQHATQMAVRRSVEMHEAHDRDRTVFNFCRNLVTSY